MLSATLSIDSNLVSGLAKLLWQTIPTFAIYNLATLIASAYNLHHIYDRKARLVPRTSLFYTFVNAPVGHPPVVTALAVILLVHTVLSLLVDFSINGETQRTFRPVLYRSVVSDHPRASPLAIDYAAEFATTDSPRITNYAVDVPREKRLVSRRLLAASEAQACLFLNGTHRTAFARAYRDIAQDKTLVPLDGTPASAVCVRTGRFGTQRVSHEHKLTGFPDAQCAVLQLNIQYEPGAIIGVAKPAVQDCTITLAATRCMKVGVEHCAAMAYRTADPSVQYILYFPDASDPTRYELHQMRDMGSMRDDERGKFAANVAFAMAIGLPYNAFNAMFVAVARFESNVTLQELAGTRDVTVINLAMLLPAAVVEGVMLVVLAFVGGWMWTKYVSKESREELLKFASVHDFFAMVKEDSKGLNRENQKSSSQMISFDGKEPRIVTKVEKKGEKRENLL